MTSRSFLERMRWPFAIFVAIVLTSIIRPQLAVAVLLGLLTVGLYLSWSRTRDRRSLWPKVASVTFSVAALGLAGVFGIGTAVGALSTVGIIETETPSPVAAEATSNAPTAAESTATVEPTTAPTPSPTLTPIPTPAPGTEPMGQTTTARVNRVIDGDTIEVDIGGELFSVRYIGIDTPETVHPTEPIGWMGPEASAANEALVSGQTVILEKDVSETDRFGRLLRYVWLEQAAGWLLVNRELVALGYAMPSSYPPDVAYNDVFRAAAREARENEAGLWGATPTPSPSPTPVPTAVPTPVPVPVAPPPPPPAPTGCHPSYSNVCLIPGIGDYDCSSGSGNGPNYVVGPVYLVPGSYDEFDLDGDGDGVGCENG